MNAEQFAAAVELAREWSVEKYEKFQTWEDVCEMFNDAADISAALLHAAEQIRWRKVKVELPDDDSVVYGWSEVHENKCYYNSVDGKWYDFGGVNPFPLDNGTITHWRPIGPGPERGEK